MKRELRISRGEIDYERELATTISYPQDFEVSEIEKFCAAYFRNRRLRESKTTDEILELAKMGKRTDKGFQPNLACVLLFAKDPRDVVPGARIRIIRYEGRHEQFGTKLNAVFTEYADGCVPKILSAARDLISLQIRSFMRLMPDGKFVQHPEYPEEAWFEAVVNAVAHRSYNLKNQNIFVKIFDDKFVVESPGGFVPPTTGSTVYDAHNPRNPFLMDAMMHLELTFCAYEGTRRMRSAMTSAGLPEPRFQQLEATSHQVIVTLENDIEHRKAFLDSEAYKYIPEKVFQTLTNDEKLICNYLAERGNINVTAASLLIGKSWPTTNKYLQALVERDVLELVSKKGKRHDATKAYQLKRQARRIT